MDYSIADLYMADCINRLNQQLGTIEKCLARLDDKQIWARGASHENAIGNLILHICGNARQWIVSGVGGVPDVRQRDAEFAAQGDWTKEELLAHLQQTVRDVIAVLETVTADRLKQIIVPQGYTTTVLGAISQVVTHLHLHTGQIIFATKILTGEDLGLFRPRATHA